MEHRVPAHDLNCRLDWQQGLSCRGIESPTPALPSTVRRPLCAQLPMTVCDDSVAGGQWYACRHCHFAGDSLALCSRAWELPLRGAVLKLISLGVELPPQFSSDEVIKQYEQRQLAPPQRAMAVWRQFQGAFFIHADQQLQVLERALHLRVPDSRDRWEQGGRHLVGCASPATECPAQRRYGRRVSVLAEPGNRQELWNRCRPGHAYRLFRGRGWQHVLVIPYFDVLGECPPRHAA